MSSKQYFDSDGKSLCFTRLSKSIGISTQALYLRYANGDRGLWLRRPYRCEHKVIDVNGEPTTLVELSRKYQEPCSVVYEKWKKGLLHRRNNNEQK